MAANYVQEGDVLTLTAPYTVISGAGAKVGNIFGVALGDVTSAATGEFKTTGVFDLLAVTADTASVGDRVLDDAARR
jgi:predicted RecA/RadA family phage recombinase